MDELAAQVNVTDYWPVSFRGCAMLSILDSAVILQKHRGKPSRSASNQGCLHIYVYMALFYAMYL